MIGLVIAAATTFSCAPAQVWDGDTFTCVNGIKIRVAGIAAREIRARKVSGGWLIEDVGCRDRHPCPSTSGPAAREALAGMLGAMRSDTATRKLGPHGHILVNGPTLRCTSSGSAGGDRQAAWCVSPVVGDLSCALVKDGYALRWNSYWRQGRPC